jgi:hypothetical protein
MVKTGMPGLKVQINNNKASVIRRLCCFERITKISVGFYIGNGNSKAF